jgi:hypothetical protein
MLFLVGAILMGVIGPATRVADQGSADVSGPEISGLEVELGGPWKR